MTDEMLKEFGASITDWTLIPSSGGVFEVELAGELVFSKKETGRHATVEELRAAFAAQLGA